MKNEGANLKRVDLLVEANLKFPDGGKFYIRSPYTGFGYNGMSVGARSPLLCMTWRALQLSSAPAVGFGYTAWGTAVAILVFA